MEGYAKPLPGTKPPVLKVAAKDELLPGKALKFGYPAQKDHTIPIVLPKVN